MDKSKFSKPSPVVIARALSLANAGQPVIYRAIATQINSTLEIGIYEQGTTAPATRPSQQGGIWCHSFASQPHSAVLTELADYVDEISRAVRAKYPRAKVRVNLYTVQGSTPF